MVVQVKAYLARQGQILAAQVAEAKREIHAKVGWSQVEADSMLTDIREQRRRDNLLARSNSSSSKEEEQQQQLQLTPSSVRVGRLDSM